MKIAEFIKNLKFTKTKLRLIKIKIFMNSESVNSLRLFTARNKELVLNLF